MTEAAADTATAPMELSHKLLKARAQLIVRDPFYGPFIMRYRCEESSVRAMATDGKVIFVSSEWCEKQTVPQLMGVLVHELIHIIYLHHQRMRGLKGFRDPKDSENWSQEERQDFEAFRKKANDAMDYTVNQNVIDDGYELPSGVLMDDSLTGSMEQIFAKLPDPPEGKGGKGSDQGWGEVLPGEAQSEEEARAEAREIEGAVREAAMAAKARGKVPGHIKELVRLYDESRVDWKTRLWQAADSLGGAHVRRSWKRPNRRFIPGGIFLPVKEHYGPGEVICALDTSGSVSDKEIAALMSEVNGILQVTKPKRLYVIQCDAEIKAVEEYDPHDSIPTEYKVKGRGGTSFQPPFDWVKKNLDNPPSYFIYLTDGECPFPNRPEYPVIWVCTTNVKAPWGETIKLTM